MSSANCRIVVFRLTGISFISYRNRQGPKTDPRGTPHSTIFHLQLSQLVPCLLKSFQSRNSLFPQFRSCVIYVEVESGLSNA